MGEKVYKKIQQIVKNENGDIETFEEVKESFIEREEPDFVKLYLNHILVQTEVKIELTPLLREILSRANYADDKRGGMYIILNKYTKEQISIITKISIQMIDKNINKFVNSKVLIRIARGTYLLNPHFFGKGHWKDIKKIRATIDFNTGEFIPSLEFQVHNAKGDVIENLYKDENGNIIDKETGEILTEEEDICTYEI